MAFLFYGEGEGKSPAFSTCLPVPASRGLPGDFTTPMLGVLEGCFLIRPSGDEFVGEESGVASVVDRFDDRRVVELLGSVEFMATGAARSVIVPDIGCSATNRGHDIPLHDLHVVDVVEKFEAG